MRRCAAYPRPRTKFFRKQVSETAAGIKQQSDFSKGDVYKRQIERYLQRVSGPLLDRIDLHVEVAPVEYADLAGDSSGESSAAILRRVLAARAVQDTRYKGTGVTCNCLLYTSSNSSAISSAVGSWPLRCSSWLDTFFTLLIVSTICTGMRMVRA